MTLEDEKAEAHQVLDLIRAGVGQSVSTARVNAALRTLGDTVGLRPFTDDGEQIFILERRV